MPRKRALRWLPLTLLVGSLVPATIYRSWTEAQIDGAVVMTTMAHAPVLTWLAESATAGPHVEETRIAGQSATLARPGSGNRWPAILFVNGATELGHLHPDVQRLVRGLARAGYLAVVPELPGLRRGEITTRTLAAAVKVASETVARPDVERGIALVGVSVGASLAMLTAADPALAGRVTVVAGVAPYTDLGEVVRMATTGLYRLRGRLQAYEPDDFVALAVARSLAADLPPGTARRALVSRLDRIPNDRLDPLKDLAAPRASGRATRALVRLLRNRNPLRFDGLFDDLPPPMRADVVRLSPVAVADRIDAPLELASAPVDKYFPVEASRALIHNVRSANLTVTSALSHAIATPSFRHVDDLVRFDGFVVRVLRTARR